MSVGPTHYEALKIRPSATLPEIKTAYHSILFANHPDKTQDLLLLRKRDYDASLLTHDDPWDPPSEQDSNIPPFGAPSPERESPRSSGCGSSYKEEDDPNIQTKSQEAGEVPELKPAEYRYGTTPNATDVDIKISNWRLYLLISSRYRFTDNVRELSDAEDCPETISFELSLDNRANPLNMIPELFVGIESMPQGIYVSNLQTVFKELSKSTSSLTITITTSPSSTLIHALPWKFGFDFDMNSQLAASAWRHLRGTCLMFTTEEPSEHLHTHQGLDTPECALKWDKGLKAKAFCELGTVRVMVVNYGAVEMWRLAAVGYRTGTAFGV
ncbi:hypothetical protein BDW02DRAFT_601483 [Decorospora gaudefroyi]|uniref:J domain-containing protein n=1 Tax=Decorospora gaudefroyi TaxID=184978 RepID=A0A6A5KBH5_9PLEO|nr:hypothetical protein BDW02DRAFT_601483 [Decorospora gaudefroyi]